ncbi:MAG: biotin/lipoyl-binding protein, partial [Curvibacter sp.]
MNQNHSLKQLETYTVDEELSRHMKTGRPFRIAVGTVFLGFAGFVAWAAWAPLNEGVPTQGVVSIDTKRKPVQHLTGGLVTEILVREGQMVRTGQVLARIDQAASRANLESEQQNYEGMKTMIESYRDQLKNQRRKRDLLQEMLKGMRELVREGYAPRNQQLDLETQIADAQVAMTDLQGNINRTKLQLLASEQKIQALTDELKRTALRAPASGQVVGLAVQSSGAVLKPADKLMDIVP